MSTELENDARFEIGHVLFIDVVGYSKLLISEQKDCLRRLTALVLATAQVAKSSDERLVKLPTGDGMALVFRHNSEQPAQCALEVAAALKDHPDLPVRMGVHSGPVSEVIDVSGRTNIAGPGINIAQRVMDCGDAGHILISQRVAGDLIQYRQWSRRLHDLGECEVKHGVRLHLVNLYLDGVGNPALPAKLRSVRGRKRTKVRTYLIAAGVLLAGLIGGAIYLSSFRSGGSPVIRSLAVLPLDNYSGDPRQDYFAEGITDELTTDIATISKLRVISRSSTTQFAGAHRPSTPEIAKILDVDALVEGSVRRSGDKVRITAQLIDARADRHLWAKSFERDSRDVLTLQDELASAIAAEVNVQLTPSEQARLTTARSVNPNAYDAYLRGRYFFNRPSDENLSKAIDQFQQAISIDPTFAPAYSGLSDAYLWAAFNEGIITPMDAKVQTRDAAEKSLQLNDASGEAHTSLAAYLVWYEHDWAGSEKEFRQAFSLNPNYAFAHDQFGLSLACQGRFDEAIAEGRRAAELDPLDPAIAVDNTLALTVKGEFQQARAEAKKAAELDPTFFFPPMQFGWIDIEQGKVVSAIPNLEKAVSMGAPTFATAWLGYAYGASGNRARALATIEELKKSSLPGHLPAFNLALVQLGLGDLPQALDLLEEANDASSQWMMYLKVDHVFDPLRSDPRFAALMKKNHFD